MRFVTAAAGRRDNYQVPIALADAGLLASHVTDAYAPDLLVPVLKHCGVFGEKILRRHNINLSSCLVHPSRRLVARKFCSAFIPSQTLSCGDQDPISWSALAQARRHDAGLMLYAGYGYQAFMAEPLSARPRVLVQYHPHIRDSATILRADADRYPFLASAVEQLKRDELDTTNLPELEVADLVICNSSFTASTCESLGVEKKKLLVIPLGIDLLGIDPFPTPGLACKDELQCEFLFVGTGIQRKGLHHLLMAWKRAKLKKSHLTIVSRWIDPEIRLAVDPGDRVTWLNSVSNRKLMNIYRKSHIFVLPSIIEGFGYVYLEAMAHGCFCIGTSNTGLPDVGSLNSCSIVPPGDITALMDALHLAELRHYEIKFNRSLIAADAKRRSWSDFRDDIVNAILSL